MVAVYLVFTLCQGPIHGYAVDVPQTFLDISAGGVPFLWGVMIDSYNDTAQNAISS